MLQAGDHNFFSSYSLNLGILLKPIPVLLRTPHTPPTVRKEILVAVSQFRFQPLYGEFSGHQEVHYMKGNIEICDLLVTHI